MNKKITFVLRLAAGLAIIYWLFTFIGIDKIIGTLKQVNVFYVILSVPVLLLTFVMTSLKINFLLHGLKQHVSYLKLFKYSSLSNSLGLLLPGKLGEFSFAYLLSREKLSLGASSAVIILDKLVMVFVIAFFAIIGTAIFFSNKLHYMIMLILLVIAATYVFFSKPVRKIIRRLLGKYAEKFTGFYDAFFELTSNHQRQILKNLTATLLRLFLNTTAIWLILLSLDVNLPIWKLFIIKSTTVMASLLPITINGLGIKESVGVYLYTLLGVPAVKAASAYIIGWALDYLLGAIFLSFFTEKGLIKWKNTSQSSIKT